MIAADLVAQVRSMLLGTLTTEMNLLNEAYDPANNQVVLKYSKRSIVPGAILSAGLNTFYVLEVSSDGLSLLVMPRYDGGPDIPLAVNTPVFVRPRLTNWAAFREIQGEARSLSSSLTGLFWPKVLPATVDWKNGIYPLPDDFGDPIRLVRSRYRFSGETAWATMGDTEYQVERRAVRVNATPPPALQVEFTFAMPFGEPVDMTTELDDLGLTGALPDILATGACATLVRSFEGRRVQPNSQGDTRRSEEVQGGMSASLARQWRAEQVAAINAEYARLTGIYGWQMALPSGGERAPWSSASARVGMSM